MPWLHRLVTVLGTLALAACGSAQRNEPLVTETLTHGPFEIVAAGKRISAGGFPNNSGNPFATMVVTAFTVRHGGKEVAVPDVGTRFWRVLRLVDAPRPALLVATTDFHLITEEGGAAVVRAFGEPTSGMAEAQWLDAEAGQPGPVRTYGIEKVALADGTAMQGGRWLKLSSRTVLDVKTLTVHPVRPWIESGSGQPMAGLNGGGIAARAFSPGGTQYVTPASDQADGVRYDALLVVDIPTGEAYGVRLDRRRMRYADAFAIDAAWIAHHFEWQREASGRERLVARKSAKPWPWRGLFVDFGDASEYHVPRAKPELADAMRSLMQARFGARIAPDWMDATKTSGYTLALPSCDHIVVLGMAERTLKLFSPPARSAPWVRCQAELKQIGEAFDAELKSGRLDTALDFAD